MLQEKLKELNEALRKHDWFYSMSDDHGVYTRGSDERKRICLMAKELGYDGQRLLNAHRDIIYNPASTFSWQDHPEPTGKRMKYNSETREYEWAEE